MNDINIEECARKLYLEAFPDSSIDCISMEKLPQAGGDRQYFRMRDEKARSCIATYTSDPGEGKCFITLARDFKEAGCAVPAIINFSEDFRIYLQEDLGDTSLFFMLKSERIEEMVKATLGRLVELQQTPSSLWSADCVNRPFSRRQVLWDLNYFKYEFLRPSNAIFDEDLLEDDFEKIAECLTSISENFWGFMMRDCQSRNVMITDEGPRFIDFQGGRYGPSLYDAVSFLWQARANFSPEFRQKMLEYYVDIYCKGNVGRKNEMMAYLPDIVLFRTLQVLGAYGFRGLVQHRAHFVMSIPSAVENLGKLIEEGALDEYAELKNVCCQITDNPRFLAREKNDVLTVEVFSFSYKRGYPEDLSGNGGGFMFDCRAMHNPGRYKEYKTLTGIDQLVRDFLEKRGEVKSYLEGAWSLIDPAVERYLSRGFSNLQIGFGCTGGQHRSVYCAVATAMHLRAIFPEAIIKLIHREHPEIEKN